MSQAIDLTGRQFGMLTEWLAGGFSTHVTEEQSPAQGRQAREA